MVARHAAPVQTIGIHIDKYSLVFAQLFIQVDLHAYALIAKLNSLICASRCLVYLSGVCLCSLEFVMELLLNASGHAKIQIP